MVLPRFYPILDTAIAVKRGVNPVDAASQILEAGAAILQFRHKGFLSREVFADLEKIAALCREAKVLLIVNDRADLARLFDAGLHLGQDDLPPQAARRITGPQLRIGFSTHNEAQLREGDVEPVDYLALGPIFGTRSKQNPDLDVGLEELRRLRPLTSRPLVAIGGITRANALSVIEAGADSVAVISDLFAAGDDLRSTVRDWVRILNTAE